MKTDRCRKGSANSLNACRTSEVRILDMWRAAKEALRKGGEEAQMTIEFACAFPVFLMLALICVNALNFFSECASFDYLFRDTVRSTSASPGYGEDLSYSISLVQGALEESFNKDSLEVAVSAELLGSGHTRFSAVLSFAPSLFGVSLKSRFFGLSLPRVSHTVSFTVDRYKPGVFL